LKKARSAPATGRPKVPVGASQGGWRTHTWRILLLWALVFAAYSNSFQAGLVFDNAPILADDPRIREVSAENLRSIFTGQYWHAISTTGLYRPLTTASYLLNYAVLGNGTRPAGYHWVNAALHGVNVTLVYALGLAIFGEPALGLALAAIWGVHPLLTESVTNIVGRADLLAAFGVLAGLLCHISAVIGGRRRRSWLAMLAAVQAIGLFSKESAAVLPGIMLLYDFAWYEAGTWRKRWTSYAVLALPFAAFLLMRTGSHAQLLIDFQENPLVGAGFWAARLTAVKVIGDFDGLFVWPANLSADHSYNDVPVFGAGGLWENAQSILALLMITGAIFLVTRWRHKQKALFFFALFFFVALLPTSNLVILIGSIMAERFMYLPAIGLTGCVVAAMAAWKWAPRTVLATTAVICLGLGARTFARNLDWHDGVSLWSSAIQACPQAARPYSNLGYELAKTGKLTEAISDYKAALRIWPDYVGAHYNLANALLRTPNGLLESIAEYQAAVRLAPNYAEAHNNLGNALALAPGRLNEAIGEFQAALKIRPDYAEAHNNLGNALVEVPGRLPQAIIEFQTAVRITPEYAEAHNNLANALAQLPGRLPEALREFQTAIRVKPDYTEAHNNLGSVLMQVPGRLTEAIAEFQTALRLDPNYAEAHNNLGSALFQSGRVSEAITEYEAAIRIQPNLADAHYNLANALLRVPGRIPQAIAELEAVLRVHPEPEARQLLEQLKRHH